MGAGQCRAITQTGKPCSGTPRPGTGFCWFHDPALAAQRADGRRRGGHNSAKEQRARKALAGGFKDVQTAQAVMLQVLARLYRGDFDPGLAVAMASVARAIDALAKTTAAAAMEEQLAAMRQQIAVLGERRGA
jgi:hypothetical protein